MTEEKFKQLQVGDQVSHPAIGIRRIIHIETAYDYDSPIRPFPTYTCAITVTDGRRMKISDTKEMKRLRKV